MDQITKHLIINGMRWPIGRGFESLLWLLCINATTLSVPSLRGWLISTSSELQR